MTTVIGLMTMAAILPAADLDNDVEWAGITHLTYHDRRPLCPLGGETFAVQVRTWTNELSSGRLWVDDGLLPGAFVCGSVICTV